VVAVALFGQRGDQGYVSAAGSGISTPADFRGKSVGFKAGVVPAELLAMLAGAGMTRDDVSLVGVGFDPRIFMEGQVDIYPVFLNNEPDTIRRAGFDINIIDPHDFDVPTLGLTFLVTRDTLADGDLVERFLRATMRATKWIEANRDEAVAVVLQHAEGADAEHQRFLLDTELDNAARADGMGRSSRDQWQALATLLREFEVTESDVDISTVFDGSVIDGLYERGEIE
jgi:NitT/TauT family transport system substrate-binding protein